MEKNSFIKLRLSVLMFLQFFCSGIIGPIMSLYLMKYLNFSGDGAGIILSVAGITAILSSIMGVLVSGKLMTVNRLLGICHLLAAAFIIILTFQKHFGSVLFLYLMYTLCFGCTNGCVSAIVFQNQKDAGKNYGGIQMWGSIGWISAGWLFSYFWLRNLDGAEAMSRLVDSLKISGGISLLLFVYTFFLPQKKLESYTRKSLLPREAIAVFEKPRNLFLAAVIFITFCSFQYYLFSISPFLLQSRYDEAAIMPLSGVAQISEAISLGILGYFITRKGYKKVLCFGLACNVLRYAALLASPALPVVSGALVCHGLASAFFFTAACIYLDSQCRDSSVRASVQQIVSILAYGFGVSFGNLFAGRASTLFGTEAAGFVDYTAFWGIPLAVSLVILILFLFFFKAHPQKQETGAMGFDI